MSRTMYRNLRIVSDELVKKNEDERYTVVVSFGNTYTGEYDRINGSSVIFLGVIDVAFNDTILSITMPDEVVFFRIKQLSGWRIKKQEKETK